MKNNFQKDIPKSFPEKAQNNFAAKKSLGQNFLHAPHIVGKMIHEAGVDKQSIVLEVGPGKGVLTRGLLDAGARVIAVEKDDRAIGFLAEKFAAEIASERLLIIHQDILEFDPPAVGLCSHEYLIAANIPYYITGEFLRKFLETDCQPQKMILMLQKEVGKRIVGENADPNASGTAGTVKKEKQKLPKESILSISVKAYGMPKYITTVPARHFRPIPKVDSALILIDFISKNFFKELSETNFFKIVKAGFAHKRKVLIKNLENLIPREILTEQWQKIGLSPTVRAENLTLEQWKRLASVFPSDTTIK